MLRIEKFFENFFNDARITSTRLTGFATDVISRLTANDTNGSNASLINLVQPALNVLLNEMSGIDATKNLKKGKTLSLNQFMADFTNKMSHFEGAVSYVFGGNKSEAYLEIFPNGLMEYTEATKLQMPLLVSRLKAAAVKYADRLDATITGQMQEFESTWQKVHKDQMLQIASLNEGRVGRSDARRELEIALLRTVHSIGMRYPGNVPECTKYFDFKLLYPQGRQKKMKAVANS